MSSLPEGKPSILALLACVLTWYSTSAVCNTTARKLLTRMPLPLWLCVVQFACAAALGFMYLNVLRPSLRVKPAPEAMQTLTRLAFVFTLGFVFVNAGYVVVNVSLAETLRSAEPIFSVLFAKLWLREEYISSVTLLSLAPIVLGGAFSSGGDSTFNLGGLFFVCMSNTAFALRSIITKHLRQVYPGFVRGDSSSTHQASCARKRRDQRVL
jgi:drug/metabolite transporter (DMT)-like permease